ncbi:hypothetical protein ACN6UL_17680, partial [Lactiplantibacillus plantarum]|uniref:hypothetical protein n=1 Tax=Lactiplantibacillus plantarum TaxID=1590 RepID=UPI003AFAA434
WYFTNYYFISGRLPLLSTTSLINQIFEAAGEVSQLFFVDCYLTDWFIQSCCDTDFLICIEIAFIRPTLYFFLVVG